MRRRAKPAKAKVEGQRPPAGKSPRTKDARVQELEKRLAEAHRQLTEVQEEHLLRILGAKCRRLESSRPDHLTRRRGDRAALHASTRASASVLALDDEERSADGAGKLRLLLRKFEAWRELRRDFHPVGQFEPDGPLLLVINRVHHIDGEEIGRASG